MILAVDFSNLARELKKKRAVSGGVAQRVRHPAQACPGPFRGLLASRLLRLGKENVWIPLTIFKTCSEVRSRHQNPAKAVLRGPTGREIVGYCMALRGAQGGERRMKSASEFFNLVKRSLHRQISGVFMVSDGPQVSSDTKGARRFEKDHWIRRAIFKTWCEVF